VGQPFRAAAISRAEAVPHTRFACLTPGSGLASLACQGVLVGVLLTGMLLFRSRASLDFIYCQF
jgi:hypothetical protein